MKNSFPNLNQLLEERNLTELQPVSDYASSSNSKNLINNASIKMQHSHLLNYPPPPTSKTLSLSAPIANTISTTTVVTSFSNLTAVVSTTTVSNATSIVTATSTETRKGAKKRKVSVETNEDDTSFSDEENEDIEFNLNAFQSYINSYSDRIHLIYNLLFQNPYFFKTELEIFRKLRTDITGVFIYT